eukprot:g72119.t1
MKKSPAPFRPSDELAEFLAGVSAGLANLVVGHPFDTIKVRLQSQSANGYFKGPWHCLVNTVRQEGPIALYQGALFPLLGKGLVHSVMFGVYGNALRYFARKESRPISDVALSSVAVSGLAAGLAGSIVCTPIDQVKVVMQVQRLRGASATEMIPGGKVYRHSLHCAQDILLRRGIHGFYGQLLPTSVEMGGGAAIYFATYATLRQAWADLPRERTPFQVALDFVAGGLAGVAFVTLMFPVETIKHRLMTRQEVGGLKKCVQQVWLQEGVHGFFKGYLPALLRTFPTNGATLTAYQLTRDLLCKPHMAL